jgi:hypothetical protein
LFRFFSVTFAESIFFLAVSRSVRCPSALRIAPSTSMASVPGVGRSVGFNDAVHSGSSVPLTINTFNASSAFSNVASAVTTF